MLTAMQSYDVVHDATAQSINEMGMRQMQQRAWEQRHSKNILIKSPPASGKSRALMFLALDKMVNQGVSKVIACVPERSIGASFKSTQLTKYGFFADWEVEDRHNLCGDLIDEASKTKAFIAFMNDPSAKILLCTHSTLRNALNVVEPDVFENTLVAVDEFHHLSVAEDNQLGNVVTQLLKNENTHVLGMTGSYFRGDTNSVMMPEHEALFDVVTFTYYEQLQGYQYLKTINIGHHFYSVVKDNEDAAPYIDGIRKLYKPGVKTIIHLPQPNSKESVDKYAEYDDITNIIGEFIEIDRDTGLSHYRCHTTGKIIKVANLVSEDKERELSIASMRDETVLEQVDIVIAVKMAMEGFDWPSAAYAITVGSRSSLTQVIQIIGRVTRDYKDKNSATFVNLIQEPLADQELVEEAVNDILKAISASLLMEQVISPRFDFKRQGSGDSSDGLTSFSVEGYNAPQSDKVKKILEQDRQSLVIDAMNQLKLGSELNKSSASLLADEQAGAQYLNEVAIPSIISKKYGEDTLTDEEHQELCQQLMLDMSFPAIAKEAKRQKQEEEKKRKGGDDDNNESEEASAGKTKPSQTIVDVARRLNVQELSLDMISTVNPFMNAYEVVARSITPELLAIVRNQIRTHRSGMTLEDAAAFYPAIKRFLHEHGCPPNIDSDSDQESQLAEALQVLTAERARQANAGKPHG